MDSDGRLMEAVGVVQMVQKGCGISSGVVQYLPEVTWAAWRLKNAVFGCFGPFFPAETAPDGILRGPPDLAGWTGRSEEVVCLPSGVHYSCYMGSWGVRTHPQGVQAAQKWPTEQKYHFTAETGQKRAFYCPLEEARTLDPGGAGPTNHFWGGLGTKGCLLVCWDGQVGPGNLVH